MKHVLFLSFGKDSTATLIKVLELKLPLDEVVYVDIRFDEHISGEHPAMAEWIPTAEKILKEQFNISVKRLSAKVTFKEQFYKIKQKGNHVGDNYGFPYIVGAWCNSRLKVEVINDYIKFLNDSVCEYVGIAFDEPLRYERLQKKSNDKISYRSVLFENGITEKQAFEICKKYNLVSPVYSRGGFRGGCWFCVKQCMADLYELYKFYPDYFNMLLELEKDSFNTFKPNLTLMELKERFDNGYIPQRRKMCNAPEQLNIYDLINKRNEVLKMENWTAQYIETVKYLERLYDYCNDKFFNNELTKPVITIQRDECNKTNGWWSIGKVWQAKGKDNEDGSHELNLTAQQLNRPVAEIAATMLHEMCHQYAQVNNMQDCSRSGTYHNKVFKKIAEMHGLNCECVKTIGWSHTTLTVESAAYIAAFVEHNPETIIYRAPVFKGQTVKTSSTRKYICPCCGQSVRATKQVNIMCMDCNSPMQEE